MTDHVLNVYDGARYTVMQYVGGQAVPPVPIIGPHNNAGAVHVAWPSAFKLPSGTRVVYASRYTTSWSDVGRWSSTDGVAYSWAGISFAANATEPHGIGPGQVYYDPSRPRPWLMAYARRTAAGSADRIDLADSADGVTWARVGPLLKIDKEYEAAGLVPSNITRANDGTWVLFYHAYRTLDQAVAAFATAPTSVGPFSNKTLIMEPSGVVHAISGGVRLSSTATVTGNVKIKEPYVLRRIGGGGLQIAWPIKQIGQTVYFDDPFLADYSTNSEIAHIARNKVDPSLTVQAADGSWSGIWTGYGMFSGMTIEYTFRVQAPQLAGPWTISKADVPFNPWNRASLMSAENPSCVIEIDDPTACRLDW